LTLKCKKHKLFIQNVNRYTYDPMIYNFGWGFNDTLNEHMYDTADIAVSGIRHEEVGEV
jgi:hypothetical protein